MRRESDGTVMVGYMMLTLLTTLVVGGCWIAVHVARLLTP